MTNLAIAANGLRKSYGERTVQAVTRSAEPAWRSARPGRRLELASAFTAPGGNPPTPRRGRT
ncbi:hypothetical protein [Streptomyces sp. NBC_00203]|uniref:hypothetical protein n=1 Tax=Streptomyces sp. NBC_00203 TaxID=2975680 RepID=UPI0032474920